MAHIERQEAIIKEALKNVPKADAVKLHLAFVNTLAEKGGAHSQEVENYWKQVCLLWPSTFYAHTLF